MLRRAMSDLDPRNPDPRVPVQPTRFCPRCKSQNVELGDYLGVRCVKCRDCGYDECQQYEVYPEEHGRNWTARYKTGGPRRTMRK